jgi:predicted transcriptional regulator of viral defense system
MNYNEFRANFHDFGLFSVGDVAKIFPEFDTRRLVEWQQKGYIKKLINKWYLFADFPLTDSLRYQISNSLYRPSYISLESALSHYSLIPEAVYSVQNITTRKTITYETPAGAFHYRSIKPHLFFGYTTERTDKIPILLADPEKAVLDYLYLNTHINTIKDIEGLRLNMTIFGSIVNWKKLEAYAACFESPALNKRVSLLKTCHHAYTS